MTTNSLPMKRRSPKMWSEKAIEAAINALWENSNYGCTRGCFDTDFKNIIEAFPVALDAAASIDGYAQWNAAIEAAVSICNQQEKYDNAYGTKYPDEQLKQDIRAHRCRVLAAAIRSLKRP